MITPNRDNDREIVKAIKTPSVWNYVKQSQSPDVLGDQFDLLNPEVDLVWGAGSPDRPPSSYFDYYYTGQDVRIIMDGAEAFGSCEVPIIDFGINIQQEKKPVWGFWSYTFDQVMYGTRLVSGQFTIVTSYPRRMVDLISEAAKSRLEQNLTPLRGLDDDEANIERYWTRTRDPWNSNNGKKHLFSIHPPFNFVLTYGVQSASITNDPIARQDAVYNRYLSDVALFQDTNERLVDSNPDLPGGKRIVENVQLVSSQLMFNTEGDVCAETYTFFARDLVDP